MIKLFFCGLFMLSAISPPEWLHDINYAKNLATKEQKLILINFSGSDWCIPCMRLRQEVFNSEAFTAYAGNHLVLLNADFPRQKKNKLTKEQEKLNDALAEKYNPQGSFPFTLLLDSNGNKLKTWDGYYYNGPERFINEIKVIAETH